MRSIGSLVLLLTISSTAALKHWFEFDGVVYCNLHKPFCFTLQFYETDRFSPNDPIGEQKGCTTDANSGHPYKVVGFQEGDGWLNNDYEIGRTVIHNCTKNGKEAKLETPYLITQGLSGTKMTMNILIE